MLGTVRTAQTLGGGNVSAKRVQSDTPIGQSPHERRAELYPQLSTIE
jgi:hypothetical protein